MADSSEPAFLFLYRKEAVAPVDYLSTFATAPFKYLVNLNLHGLLRKEVIFHIVNVVAGGISQHTALQ